MDANEATTCIPQALRRDFRALGLLVSKCGPWLIFHSLLPVADSDSLLIHGSMAGVTATPQYFIFCDGMAHMAPGLLASDEIHLSQNVRRAFA